MNQRNNSKSIDCYQKWMTCVKKKSKLSIKRLLNCIVLYCIISYCIESDSVASSKHWRLYMHQGVTALINTSSIKVQIPNYEFRYEGNDMYDIFSTTGQIHHKDNLLAPLLLATRRHSIKSQSAAISLVASNKRLLRWSAQLINLPASGGRKRGRPERTQNTGRNPEIHFPSTDIHAKC